MVFKCQDVKNTIKPVLYIPYKVQAHQCLSLPWLKCVCLWQTSHKKTFYYLEQLILKHKLHTNALNIKEIHGRSTLSLACTSSITRGVCRDAAQYGCVSGWMASSRVPSAAGFPPLLVRVPLGDLVRDLPLREPDPCSSHLRPTSPQRSQTAFFFLCLFLVCSFWFQDSQLFTFGVTTVWHVSSSSFIFSVG